MQEDALKWNKKHLEHPMPHTPSDLLQSFLPTLLQLPSKYALDIACGNGRNSKFLAQHGFVCDSVDISEVALQMSANHPKIHTICADLDTYRPTPNHYDVVLNFYFLNRDLFPFIQTALKSKGIFLLETFIKEEDGFNSSQIIDEKILNHGELEHTFKDFEILHKHTSYITRREGEQAKIISFVAQKS
ncbi:class I SAM-dependent methyltransferase [Helicobacter pametensis]|uniref:class I SAM-dependent methyltransferase n=1 Tax=Helicobacter pametensis TaxID=95149 RepID=UPI0004B39D13|nr:class I SAM-dependent methyltransferase [Helicobacter pametensis]